MDILLVLGLIALNGVFALSEMSLVSSKKVRLQQLVDKGSIGAARALALQDNPGYFLSTIQVGITTIGILSGIVGEKSLVEPVSLFYQDLGIAAGVAATSASVTVIIFLTFMSVVFGEIIPKRLGLMLPEKVASILAIPMSWLSKITFPIVWLFNKTTNICLKLLRMDNYTQLPASNEEIKDMMIQGTESGVFHPEEHRLVSNILHMDERKVNSIMTHRADLFYIDIDDSYEENIEKIVNGSFSRILVIKEDLNNIIGILHITDILTLIQKNKPFKFEDHVNTPLYLPETIMASQVLESFKKEKTEAAIIVDEYGENIGIVTLVDVMEAIVGDIAVDNGEEDSEITQRDDGTYLVDGLISLDKIANLLEIDEDDLPVSEGMNTLAGLIMEQAEKIPPVGFKIELKIKNLLITLEIMDMDKNCIDKVLLKKEEFIEKEVVQVEKE